MPKHTIDAASLINNVRNKFAHELELDSFDGLDVGRKRKLKDKCRISYPDEEFKGLTVTRTFEKIVFGVILENTYLARLLPKNWMSVCK